MITPLRILSVVSPVLLLATGCGAGGDPAPAPRESTPVSTIAVAETDGYFEVSSYTGRVEAVLDSPIGFEIGGQLAGVLVDEGDTVSRHSVLARLDTARLEAGGREASAGLDQVRAELALARSTLARTRDAIEYKGVSQQQLDEAEQRLSALVAAERVAAAKLDRIDVDIAKSSLVAPFDGVIIARFADPGQVLATGQPLLQIQSSAAPEVRIGVAPEAARSLQVGGSYRLLIGGANHGATLLAVIPRRDEAARTVDARFALDEADASLRPGDLAEFETSVWIAERGFWVPVAALIQGPRGLWQTLVVEPLGTGGTPVQELETRIVEVLYADADHALVRGTLTPGELLVSDGGHRVVAGQSVTVASIAGGPRLTATTTEAPK